MQLGYQIDRLRHAALHDPDRRVPAALYAVAITCVAVSGVLRRRGRRGSSVAVGLAGGATAGCLILVCRNQPMTAKL